MNQVVAFIATGNHVIADTATVINTSRNSLSAICPVSGNRDGPHMIIYLAYNNNIRAIENARWQPDQRRKILCAKCVDMLVHADEFIV